MSETERLKAAEALINSIAPVLFPYELYDAWIKSGGCAKPDRKIIQEEALGRSRKKRTRHDRHCTHC